MATAAAVAEEVAYRGVLFVLLAEFVTPLLAALISATAFGLAHLAQGPRGALASAGFGLAMQGLFVLGGPLLLPMLTHLGYDLAVAWLGRRLALRDPEVDAG